MNKSVYVIVIAALFVASLTFYLSKADRQSVADGQGACTLEARLCPDGSSVGRVGPSCNFAACPPVGVALDESVTFGGTDIVPRRVVEDSRCPVDATCTWAGTFLAEVAITSPDTDVDEVRQLSIGDTIVTSFGTVVLDSVAPPPTTGGIADSDYELIFVEE